MTKLSELPNIGKTLEEKLLKIGIYSPEKLCEAGAKEVFCRIYDMEHDGCCCMVYALEGAIRGIRWHYLEGKIKKELEEFHKSVIDRKYNY